MNFNKGHCSPIALRQNSSESNNGGSPLNSCINRKLLEKIGGILNKNPNCDSVDCKCETGLLHENICKNMSKISDCNSEQCWITVQEIVNNLNKNEIDEFKEHFKPKMPDSWESEPNKWLNTEDIDNVMLQYEKAFKDFEYLGAHPIDAEKCSVSQEVCKINLKDLKKNGKEKIGIIGSSGCGKSTLIDIICGFIKIYNGDVFVDKKSIYNNLNGWQKQIGYIPQKIVILNDTLRNNILFGLDNKDYNDSKLRDILQKVNLKDFYKQLPNGLSEKISEEGLNISGGEVQRIGIARALVNNPEIIFLDEATSALDTFTENKILKEINSLKKTVISVSHRINALRYCDKIYRIEKGQIKDSGNFKKFINV